MPARMRNDIEQQAATWLARRETEDWRTSDATALQRWLDAAVTHRVAYLRLESAWQQCGRLKALGAGLKSGELPERGLGRANGLSRRDQMLEALAPTRSRESPGAARARAHYVVGGIAASLILSVALIAWQSRSHVDSARFSTAVGELATRHLADGSTATMASDSVLEVQWSRDQRRVELFRGEALFDVAKDAARPFVVHAGSRRIVAVGTRFSVRRDAEQLRIVVAEGTVRLQSEHELASSGGALLPAGSVVRIEGRNELVQQLEIAEVERLLRWRDGVLAFRDVTLREAVAEFNRYNRRRIVIEDAAVGELPIGGHFRFDNVETFVRLIERGFPVRAEFLADRIILRAP